MKKLHFKNRYLLITDIFMCVFAHALILLITRSISCFSNYFIQAIPMISATTFVYCLFIIVLKNYYVDWEYSSTKEYTSLLASCILASVTSIFIGLISKEEIFYFKLNVAANLGTTTLICFVRFFVKVIHFYYNSKENQGKKRLLIIGAGRLAVTLIREISENNRLNYDVVGLIDDDPEKQKHLLYSSKILGTRDDIERICDEMNVDEIIFAICTIHPASRAEILDICSKTGKKVKILPGIEASFHTPGTLNNIREVNIEDLLGRDPIVLDNQLIEDDINGKTVLVTGGGGSIGSELCRQIIKYNPQRLVILDIYENTTYELENELREKYPNNKIDVLIGSVRDKRRLDEIFGKYRPDLVFHAAAHKHVPLMEYSPCEAIKNNIFGTYNTAVCAQEFGVKKFVMISTDKAVNPTNVMGASKRMCEMIVQTLQQNGETDFVAVRFGNVLGSNGSVIPKFKKQIAAGGPVTVTHPDITRFFMTIPEAARLVLQAASYASGGEIFVLDMGKPVKIYDLAKKLISLSGYKPEKDIEIKFTGLRPGEKLYEELLMSEEGLKKTDHSKIFIGRPGTLTLDELKEKLDKLRDVTYTDEKTVKKIISEVVPTYHYNKKTNKSKETPAAAETAENMQIPVQA